MALLALNGALAMCAQLNMFSFAPHVAYCVAIASGVVAAFMKEWPSADASVTDAAIAAAPELAKVIGFKPKVVNDSDKGAN